VNAITATQSLQSEANSAAREWVAAFAEGWRAPSGADAFVEHFRPLLTEGVRLVQPGLRTLVGRDAFEREFARPLFALVPDLHGQVESWAARAETLYIEITLTGSVGRSSVSWRACDRVTLRDGLALERESYFDAAALLAAIALHPTLWPRLLRIRLRAALRTLNPRRTP
jgi:hypothetical protein